ncbi:MAG: universal stress protein [Thermodesulfobacteriota bacterium]
MYRKILVPLDGSAMAECALSHIESILQEGAAAEVTLLNVVAIHISWTEVERGHVNYGALQQQILNASKNYLKEAESRLRSDRIEVRTESIPSGRPADAIADYAKNEGMELIVMATHGHTGFKKFMLGSVASGVLDRSHVPVLLIRPEACIP